MAAKKEAAKKKDKKEERVLTKPERMKKALDKQEKKEVYIPLEGKEPEGAVETVILNGYRYDIKKGVRVEVPAQVADIIYDAMEQTRKAHTEALKRAGKAEELE